MSIPYERWKEEVLTYMDQHGWIFDRDDETILGFHKYDSNGNKWIREFSKGNRLFVTCGVIEDEIT